MSTALTAPEKTTIACSTCAATACVKPTAKGLARVPKGWKRIDGQVRCKTCVQGAYVLRAVELPIGAPVDMTWQEFHALIREQWSLMSQCATWMIRELYIRDTAREAQEKLPKMPRIYLYPEAVLRFPAIEPTTIASLEQAVQSKYRKQRYGVVWALDEQLQTLRYPQPFVSPAQAWSISLSDDARKDMLLSVRIGRERRTLRLRGGKRMRYQRRQIEQLIDGSAVQGELAIFRRRTGRSDRAGKSGQTSSSIGTERGENGRVQYDVVVKLVGRFPRGEARPKDGALYVRTDASALLIMLDDAADRLINYHARHLRQWIAEHKSRLQAWGDDTKFEHRPVPAFADRRRAACEKHRRRVQSLEKQVAAVIAGYCQRNRIAAVNYDDGFRGYLPEGFDWSGLKLAIGQKCAAIGVEFHAASGDVDTKTMGGARDVEYAKT